MKTFLLATALLGLFAAGAARAEDEGKGCNVPKDKWMTEDAMKDKAKAMGLDVRRVKVENGCYEVYAIDAKGAKVETIFNPETGEPVGSEGAE
ncbi:MULTISPECIES: PepSY domain-containing protein [unclassified Shinella]|jgi:hypothetical protein|uniref:PepSY domain-containing protein n=1 Tax=unclassified Shinella TaxID=2643062 RepID=UPI0003C56366|nr:MULTISPECIES: PepSY domain-containing protein [unclassified Shinella]MCA0339012.1 PepSY domain-containing protein [Pseudomonadota bacterium]EYR82597.1 hypothetical protein SHLA_59c000080 [Shinella sp. DD12]MCO5148792.1 PepSY domain-containing protein [Shinella sp.]MDC7264854.1 PepSY domain-containing protein [Shinella sp. HY16]MDC7271751.1 PepSY domain-containing protein [Shinella sp. YZ44]